MKIDLNDGNWEVLKPVRPINGKVGINEKLHSLDDLDGPTDKELSDIENKQGISKILDELDFDAYLWNLN